MSDEKVTEMPSVRQRIGFVAVMLGMFMAILDIQIVASSLNEIQAGVSHQMKYPGYKRLTLSPKSL